MKKIFSIIFSCIIFISLVGCDDSSSSSGGSSLHSGESVTLSVEALVCSSKANVDKMISFIQEKNNSGEDGMILRGEAKVLSKGTKVNIIKIGPTVEIETQNGQKWFAPREAIK